MGRIITFQTIKQQAFEKLSEDKKRKNNYIIIKPDGTKSKWIGSLENSGTGPIPPSPADKWAELGQAFGKLYSTEVYALNVQGENERLIADVQEKYKKEYGDNWSSYYSEDLTAGRLDKILYLLYDKDLIKISIPDELEMTKLQSFYGTGEDGSDIREFIINGVKRIGEVTLPNTIKKVPDYAFSAMPCLSKINGELEAIVTTSEDCHIGVNTEQDFGKQFSNTALEDLDFCKKVKMFPMCAFENAHITEVNLPEAEIIGPGCFENNWLTSVILPKVKIIDEKAFKTNNNLTVIDIGTELIEIQKYWVGDDVVGTIDYIFRSTTPPILGNYAFLRSANYIYVPDSAVTTYKSATNWVNFNNIIKPLSTYQGGN